jgi:Protein of unknown function (DUF2865)
MRFAGSACCAAILLLGFGAAAISVRVDGTEHAQIAQVSKEPPAMARTRSAPPEQRIANADWADRLRSEDFWQGMRSPQSRPDETSRRALGATRSEGPRRFSPIQRGDEGRSRAPHFASGSYRTVCVRLCDGYFWPLSFAVSRAALQNDGRKCEESCESPVKLFLAKDAETALEDMRDENGRYYRDLKTAFVYRTFYVESCKCRAHPWEPAAQARHAAYARGTRPSQLRR